MGTLEHAGAEDLPAPAASAVSPDLVRDYRQEFTRGEDVIDPATFSGSIPQTRGVAPRVRVGRGRWFNRQCCIEPKSVLATAQSSNPGPTSATENHGKPGIGALPRGFWAGR